MPNATSGIVHALQELVLSLIAPPKALAIAQPCLKAMQTLTLWPGTLQSMNASSCQATDFGKTAAKAYSPRARFMKLQV